MYIEYINRYCWLYIYIYLSRWNNIIPGCWCQILEDNIYKQYPYFSRCFFPSLVARLQGVLQEVHQVGRGRLRREVGRGHLDRGSSRTSNGPKTRGFPWENRGKMGKKWGKSMGNTMKMVGNTMKMVGNTMKMAIDRFFFGWISDVF